jgi:hypothetical protein
VVLPRLVAHAHDHGFATQFGFAQALTGRIEAVHVDVTDDAILTILISERRPVVILTSAHDR